MRDGKNLNTLFIGCTGPSYRLFKQNLMVVIIIIIIILYAALHILEMKCGDVVVGDFFFYHLLQSIHLLRL